MFDQFVCALFGFRACKFPEKYEKLGHFLLTAGSICTFVLPWVKYKYKQLPMYRLVILCFTPPVIRSLYFCLDFTYITRIFCQSIYIRNFSTTKNHNQARPKAQPRTLFVMIKHYLLHMIAIDNHYP